MRATTHPAFWESEVQLARFSDEQLAAELQRRNWVVMEP
jgi:hypothetical protein